MSAIVQVPDQIGVYKFVVAHHRTGISPINLQEVVPVRPFLHNEYDRFLRQALPYYVTTFMMIFGVLLLGVVLLYAKDPETDSQKTQSEGSGSVTATAREGLRRRKGKQS